MKSKNAKRIAAVAASLLMGLAFAGQGVTFGNIPIINSQGQPVVQIVVGGTAQPSDGVVAANIAAVIGNLAYTSTNVTATVSGTSGVNCVVTTPTCTISNAQVWLGESGTSVPASSYGIYALIGSVLNQGIPLSTPDATKTLQSTAGTQYAFPEVFSLTVSPQASPYTPVGSVPVGTTATAASNGGGVTFTGFAASGSNIDNILKVSNSQLPQLASNWGGNGENEFLWLSGFPVYDQLSTINNFRVLSAGTAYQITFNKPIQNVSSSGALGINVPIEILGQNYTILNESGGGTMSSGQSNTNTVAGGSIKLAATLVPAQTVYVGHNVTTGPWTVQLQDLGQPSSTAVSAASVAIYYNGQLTNTTSITPGTTTKFNYTGHTVYVNVQSTFAGLYAYQKWAKMQVYSNVLNLNSSRVYNQSTNPGWNVYLLWTNTTSGTKARALQSLIIYNTTTTDLAPGGSINIIQNPSLYKFSFVGDTLASSQYDQVSASLTSSSSVTYQNLAGSTTYTATNGNTITASNLTEPVQYLTVTSSIPNSLTYAGQTGSSVQYDLTPYAFTPYQDRGTNVFGNNAISFTGATGSNVVFTYNGPGAGTWVSTSNPVTVTITGYTSNSANQGASTATATFQSNTATAALSTMFYNVTGIKISRALPGALSVKVYSNSLLTSNGLANGIELAQLHDNATLLTSGAILYGPLSGQSYYAASTSTALTYNPQNGQPTTTWTLTGTPADQGKSTLATDQEQYWWFAMNSIPVTTNTGAVGAFAFGVANSTSGVNGGTIFNINYTAHFNSNVLGQSRNVTYLSSGDTKGGSSNLNVRTGFTGERGTKVTSISSSSDTFAVAKVPDTLLLTIGPSTSTNATSSTSKNYGPYKVGQSTNLANVTIANVTATCTGGSSTSSSCTVTGLTNLTATPSVTQAVTPVKLNTATTPLAVLDSNANQAATLVLVGSKYVNSVSAQLFSQNPSLASSFGPGSVVVQAFGGNRILVAGYTANQTVTAGNQFIQDLLSAASS